MMRRADIPLDDMPDDMIERRAAAVRGEVMERASVFAEFSQMDDGPSEDDLDRFSGVTQTCWRCGTELYDDAATCWNCQADVGPGSGPRGGPPRWAILAAIATAAIFVLVYIL